jgi:predicted MFS family arabinose efflux permease
VLFLAALTGALNVAGISSSAFVSLDQAILPQLSQPGTRNRNFGIYNAVALVGRITGSLASGTSSAMHSMAGFALVDAYRLVLGCFVGSAAISLTCILALSVEIESQPDGRSASHGAFHLVSSRKHVLRMSLLFCIDSFSSGLVNSSMVVLLFHQRFGVGAEVLGPTYSAARVLQGISYMVAAKLADRSGLLNTMVFTHLPSQLLLMALPFAPTLPIGIVILLVRQGLAHMDLPTRQAYLAAIVQPEERTSAASITNLARNLAQSISPTLSGFAYQVFLYTAPFLMAGLLGILYDVGLYLRFRKVVPEREELAMALGAPEITFHRD